MKIALIIAQNNFRDEEYEVPKKTFEDAGFETTTLSKTTGICTSKFKKTVQATDSIDNIDVADYDAIVFIGGGGSAQFQHDVQAHMTAQEAINQNKVLAAICLAPSILALAGVLEGKNATAHPGEGVDILKQQGVNYIEQPVVVDGKIVTADGPASAKEFADKVVELLR
jgi:protease I